MSCLAIRLLKLFTKLFTNQKNLFLSDLYYPLLWFDNEFVILNYLRLWCSKEQDWIWLQDWAGRETVLRHTVYYMKISKFQKQRAGNRRIIDLFSLKKKKKTLGSASPNINPALPVNHVPKSHIYISFKRLQGWWFHYFPLTACTNAWQFFCEQMFLDIRL